METENFTIRDEKFIDNDFEISSYRIVILRDTNYVNVIQRTYNLRRERIVSQVFISTILSLVSYTYVRSFSFCNRFYD